MYIKSRIFLSLVFVLLSGLVIGQSDFNIVKQRVVSEILDGSVNDSRVAELFRTIKEDGTWPGINYEDVSNTGFEHSMHLNNMVTMSMAFKNEKSTYYESQQVSELINRSLNFWCDHDFICENWWHNQIGTPTALVTVLLVMDDQIDPELKERTLPIIGRAHLDASGARPGGDRIKVGGIAAKKGLVVGDEAQFEKIMKVINDEIKFTTGNRGMQHDYSFHHRVDRVNTTYSYGGSYASIFAEWAAYVAGTSYAFSEEKTEQLIDYYLDGICKQYVYGIRVDKGVMNRGITRRERYRPGNTSTPEKLLLASDYRKEELEEIISLRRGASDPVSSFAKFYWQSEHFVCQRPGFYTSVRMFSVRNRNMEVPYNSEGLLNHHRGDGTNMISVKGNEYLNIWPVYDWQKIPGTTVLQKPALPSPEEIQKDGLTDFVGAVTDGHYGAVAFDFISPHDFIRARKSWFFFENAYVCLGAGIESQSNHLPVVTTLNQAHLKGDVVVSNGKGLTTLAPGDHQISNAKWVFHAGIGYLFPKPTDIHLSNQEESGYWTDINKQWSSPSNLVKQDVFKLWIDHGTRPQGRQGGLNHASMVAKDVKYQYMVIPSAKIEQMEKERGIEILTNSRLVQAVMDHQSGMIQVIFYEAGTVVVSDELTISSESPGAVMLKVVENVVKEISVADPSRELSRMHLSISGQVESMDQLVSAFDSKKMISNLTIDLPAGHYAGQSVTIK